MTEKENADSLDGIYQFLSEAYRSNWEYRWQGTPYLRASNESGKTESVAGHMWGTVVFWSQLRRICPALDSLVDSTQIYEILIIHDLGEIDVHDLPLYNLVNGEVDHKQSERDSLLHITSHVPNTQKELMARFDEFENGIEKIDSLEMLIAKWMDSLQGNHFALTFGNNLPQYSEVIAKILQIRFTAYNNRLINVLAERKETKAKKEVQKVAKHHAELIRAAGIDFDASKLNA